MKKYQQELSASKLQRSQNELLYKSLDNERRKLMFEVTQQNKLVDSLSREKTSLLMENKETRFVVQDLEDQVTNLTQDIHMFDDLHRTAETSNNNNNNNTSSSLLSAVCLQRKSYIPTKESLKERERISKRYRKYKDAMDSIKADLSKTPHSSPTSPLKVDISSHHHRRHQQQTISPIRRVTVSDEAPTVHDYVSSQPT